MQRAEPQEERLVFTRHVEVALCVTKDPLRSVDAARYPHGNRRCLL